MDIAVRSSTARRGRQRSGHSGRPHDWTRPYAGSLVELDPLDR